MWRKSSWKLLVIRLAEGLRIYVPFVFFHTVLMDNLHGWVATAWRVLFWLVTLDRLHTLFYDWAATRFRMDGHGISVDLGLLNKKTTSLKWSDISSIQVSQSAPERTLRCATLTLGLGAHSKQHIALAGLDRAEADRIAELYEEGRDAPEKVVDEPAAPPDPDPETRGDEGRGRLIYRISPVDYLVISLTYAQFLLLIPFGFSVISDLSEYGGEDALMRAFRSLTEAAPPWVTAVTGGAVVLLAALVYGYALTWLRFGKFEVRERAAVFGIQGGAFARGRHQISTRDVHGLRLRQNPVMRAFGYAQLSLMSRDSAGGDARTQKIMPVAKTAYVEEIIATYFPHYATLTARRPVPATARALLITGVVLSLLACSAVSHLFIAGRGFIVLLIPLILVHVAVLNARWTDIDVDGQGESLFYCHGLLWRSEYRVRLYGVHATVWASNPVSRRLGWQTLIAYVFSGTPIFMRAPVADRYLERVFADRLSAREEQTAVLVDH